MKKFFLVTILIASLVLAGCGMKNNTGVNNNSFGKNKNGTENAQVSSSTGGQLNGNSEALKGNEQQEDFNNASGEKLATDDWRVYEKEEMNVSLKYHKDWYYQRDSFNEKAEGYDLYVGFAPNQEFLNKGKFYPVEFIVMPTCDCLGPQEIEYSKTVEKAGKDYIIRTINKEEYGAIVDAMAETLNVKGEEKTTENNEVSDNEVSETCSDGKTCSVITDVTNVTVPKDWNTYTNDKYGFGVQYPESFKFFTMSQGAYAIKKDQTEIQIFTVDGYDHGFEGVNYKKKDIFIDGKPAERLEISTDNGIDYIIRLKINEYPYYQSDFRIETVGVKFDDLNTIDAIISTFKFID